MTATLTPGGNASHGEGWQKSWQPTYTAKGAAKSGVADKATYREVTPQAIAIVEEHLTRGTARHLWEPTTSQVRQLVDRYIQAAEQELGVRLVADVDPALDDAQQALEDTKARLDAAEQMPESISTPESNTTYSGAEAVNVHETAGRKIESDIRNGKAHHRRSSPVLKRVGRWAPWVEAVGFLAFVSYYMNVPLLQPWVDWLGWTFAISVVVFIILGQTWLVHHAAHTHNHGREEAAEGNRHQAEAANRRRDWYLAATAVVALAITSGMILRGTAALGDARLGTTMVMVFLAVVTGLLMPILAYLATALDGSKVSRERDSLAADLEKDFADQANLVDECKATLALVTDTKAVMLQKVFPHICDCVQSTADAAHVPYTFCRTQIGGLAADPPSKAQRAIQQTPEGALFGVISTGLPGAATVDLLSLLDRVSRLYAIDAERAALQQRLELLRPHPWTKSSQPL